MTEPSNIGHIEGTFDQVIEGIAENLELGAKMLRDAVASVTGDSVSGEVIENAVAILQQISWAAGENANQILAQVRARIAELN